MLLLFLELKEKIWGCLGGLGARRPTSARPARSVFCYIGLNYMGDGLAIAFISGGCWIYWMDIAVEGHKLEEGVHSLIKVC